MARRGSRRSRRDTVAIPKRSLPRFSLSTRLVSPSSTYLREFEDRRYWHPEGVARPAASFFKPRHRLTVIDRRPGSFTDPMAHLRAFPDQTRALVAFAEPSRVLVCVRRRIRSEVLHALGKTGRGGQKPPVKNWTSEISCKE